MTCFSLEEEKVAGLFESEIISYSFERKVFETFSRLRFYNCSSIVTNAPMSHFVIIILCKCFTVIRVAALSISYTLEHR